MKLVNSYRTIEYTHEAWWLCDRGEYPDDSVLAGQHCRSLREQYRTLEEAKAANPGVEVSDAFYQPPEVPVNPPDWFDPAYAGERWDEDY